MILLAPVKTEKAISEIEYRNTLTFVIDMKATKKDVKGEVEKLFNVKVAAVRTFITSKGEKRAFVRLDPSSKADEVAAKLKMLA